MHAGNGYISEHADYRVLVVPEAIIAVMARIRTLASCCWHLQCDEAVHVAGVRDDPCGTRRYNWDDWGNGGSG
jgi:hypothetical protein